MNGSLDTYGHHLFWFWKFFLCRRLTDDQTHLHWLHLSGKLLKGHLWKLWSIKIEVLQVTRVGIELVALTHAAYKIGDIF